MNLDQEIRLADERVQALIDEHADRLVIRNRFAWEYARRSFGQRLRNDGRERKHGKAQGMGVGARHV